MIAPHPCTLCPLPHVRLMPGIRIQPGAIELMPEIITADRDGSGNGSSGIWLCAGPATAFARNHGT